MPRTKAVRGAVDNDILAPDIQQRADNGNLRIKNLIDHAMGHALETRKPGAAQKMHEYSFNLIIGSMTNCHCLRFEMSCLCHEEAITQDPRGFFNGKFFALCKATYIAILDH